MNFEESANHLANILLKKKNVPILVISHPGKGSWYAVHYCLHSECDYKKTAVVIVPDDDDDDISMFDSYYFHNNPNSKSNPLTESELFHFVGLMVSYKKAVGDKIVHLNKNAPLIFDLDASLYSKETIDKVKLFFDNIVEFA